MADTVRYLMEEMVPELEDMQKKRYFSRAEIKEIVKRRQEFEYKLKRKAALKEDYYSYAEYETKLEQLRQARRRGLGLANTKQTLADYALVRRVHFIFERAARKFKRDLGVWTRWLEFCRATRSNRRLSRVAARALQLHPNAPGLWTYAAAWEFEENANPGAARALMQQGLRMCKDSRQMWLQYFDMELMYVEKLRARRAALGLDVPQDEEQDGGQQQQQQQQQQQHPSKKQQQQAAKQQEQQAEGEDGEGPLQEGEDGGQRSILESLEGGGQQQPGTQQQGSGEEDDADAAVAAVLRGAVAAVVARSAAAALPQDLELRRGLLAAAGRYTFPGAGPLARSILEGIAKDFPLDPDAVDTVARHSCDSSQASPDPAALKAACSCFEDAIAAAASEAAGGHASGSEADDGVGEGVRRHRRQQREKERATRLAGLWERYGRFLKQRVDAALAAAAGGTDEAAVRGAAEAAQALLRVLQAAHEAGAAGEAAYELWSEAALQLGQRKLALRAARLACHAFPSSPDAWRRRVELEGRLRGAAPGAAAQLLAALQEAIAHVAPDRAPEMWLAVLDACQAPEDLKALSQTLVQSRLGAARGPAAGGMGHAAGCVLAAVWETLGAAAGRELFAQLAALPPAGGDFYRQMLELEGRELEREEEGQQEQEEQGQEQQQRKRRRVASGQAAGGGKAVALQRVRRVLEAGVDAYGDCDAALWLAYARFEQGQAKQGAGPVYWRAVKALSDPEPFIQAYRTTVCEAPV